jgi:hypothetical protein
MQNKQRCRVVVPYTRVPPVLLKADPRLSADRFDAVKTDPTFLYRTLSMCEDCAVQHNAVVRNPGRDNDLCLNVVLIYFIQRELWTILAVIN